MRRYPSRRPYRKRYVVVLLRNETDRKSLIRELNRHGKRGMCPAETDRPWLSLIDITGPYAIVRVPHTCLETALKVLPKCHSVVRTVRTSGTVKKARRIIAGKMRYEEEKRKRRFP